MFCKEVKTPISIDAEPGGDVCNSSEDIDDKQSNSNIHVPSSFKNQTLIKVPLVAIHNSKPGASLSQDISPTTRRATTWQPRRYNKALLQQSTLWSSPPVKNTSSSPHTHSVDMHDKVPSSSTSPSSPSSSSGPKNHGIKTVSERLMRPTAADRSRNWNNPRNQLHQMTLHCPCYVLQPFAVVLVWTGDTYGMRTVNYSESHPNLHQKT